MSDLCALLVCLSGNNLHWQLHADESLSADQCVLLGARLWLSWCAMSVWLRPQVLHRRRWLHDGGPCQRGFLPCGPLGPGQAYHAVWWQQDLHWWPHWDQLHWGCPEALRGPRLACAARQGTQAARSIRVSKLFVAHVEIYYAPHYPQTRFLLWGREGRAYCDRR